MKMLTVERFCSLTLLLLLIFPQLEKCPNTELFSRIRCEYGKIMTRENSVFGHFSYSVDDFIAIKSFSLKSESEFFIKNDLIINIAFLFFLK